MVLWLSRQRELSTRAAVVLLGVIPGLWCLSSSAFGLPVFSTRVAWMVLIPTLAAVMYGRAVAMWSAVIGLTSLTAVDIFTESPALVVLNAVSGIAILALVVFVVNGTALQLRATVRQLEQSQADRDLLQHSLDDAADRERAKIATELHDDTIQVMTAATMRLDMARAKQPTVGGKPFDLGEPLELMQEAIARARRLSFDLYPPALDNGLRPALKEIAHRIERDAGFTVVVDATPERFSAEQERLVFRTAKELLENARKHAQAELVELTVRMEASALVLLVADNGRGFDHARRRSRATATFISVCGPPKSGPSGWRTLTIDRRRRRHHRQTATAGDRAGPLGSAAPGGGSRIRSEGVC